MTTQTAPHLRRTPCTGIQHTTNRRVLRHPDPAKCESCHGTGYVMECTGCGIRNCDGDCPCTDCFGAKTITCTAEHCDQGLIFNEAGEVTGTCKTCKGEGEVPCPCS